MTDVIAHYSHMFSITSGNSAGLFTIDSTGTLRVANEAALQAATPGVYPLQVLVTDSGSPPLSANAPINVTVLASDIINAAPLQRAIWNNIVGGTAGSDLT